MIGFEQFKNADAPFIRSKRLRKLICQLGTSKDIKFREEDEGAVLRIARHFAVFVSAFRYCCTVESDPPAKNAQSSIGVVAFTFPRRTRPSAHKGSMRALRVSDDGNSVYLL